MFTLSKFEQLSIFNIHLVTYSDIFASKIIDYVQQKICLIRNLL